MTPHRNLVLVVLAMVLGGCTTMVRGKVEMKDGNLVIVERPHHTPFVKPGQRIVWTCECPPGTEFAIADLRFVADLDEILEAFTPPPNEVWGPDELNTQIEYLQQFLPPPAAPAEPTYKAYKGRAWTQKEIDAAWGLLTNLKSALSPPKGERKLLKDRRDPQQPNPPSEFVDGSKRIKSVGRVQKGIGNGVWMFTWKVRRKGGGPEITWGGGPPSVELDPHIVGHEERTEGP